MNAVTKPAFAHLLPSQNPSLSQLAALLVFAGRTHSRAAADPLARAHWQMDEIETAESEAADAFFTALERETGISRDMIREIGGMA